MQQICITNQCQSPRIINDPELKNVHHNHKIINYKDFKTQINGIINNYYQVKTQIDQFFEVMKNWWKTRMDIHRKEFECILAKMQNRFEKIILYAEKTLQISEKFRMTIEQFKNDSFNEISSNGIGVDLLIKEISTENTVLKCFSQTLLQVDKFFHDHYRNFIKQLFQIQSQKISKR